MAQKLYLIIVFLCALAGTVNTAKAARPWFPKDGLGLRNQGIKERLRDGSWSKESGNKGKTARGS
jgi:hypothetical protein